MLRQSDRLQDPRWSLRRRARYEISLQWFPDSSCSLDSDYYKHAPKGFHIIGFDGSGTVLEVGQDCEFYKPGDDISYIGATTRQGSNAEYQLVSEFSCAHKPKSLDFVQAASFGLTFGTAYQSLHDRLEIKPGENVGILIVRRGICFHSPQVDGILV
jgi:D-arabinose 1-dehydrogenase-like Zn-dependent alcohol dehydrogenase